LWRDALLVAGKDLRIEARSRVGAQQVAPFAVVVLIIFAFAFDADHTLMRSASAGLFWVAVLFAGVLTVQRSFALEAPDGLRDGLRLSGMDPAGIFLGKAAAVAGQLLVLEVVLAGGIAFLYSASLRGAGLLVLSAVLATVGLSAAGTVYGIVAAGLGVRETLLPLLLLPVVAPVLLAASKVWSDTLSGAPGAWGWLRILVIFAVVSVAAAVGLRPLLRGLQQRSEDPNLNARGNSLIGKIVVLDQPILGGRGRMKMGDGSWTVTGPDMVAGSKVRVAAVDGTELRVEPAP